MSAIIRILGLALLGISALILLEYFGVFSAPINLLLVGSVGIIVFQSIHFVTVKMVHGHVTFMNISMPILLCTPAIWYLGSLFFGLPLMPHIDIILPVILAIEALYALH